MMNKVFYNCDEYYLSYLHIPSALCQELDSLLVGRDNPGIGKSETAICINEPWKCLILYGDHRVAMEPIKDNLDALKQYWLDNNHLIGHTSDLLED